MRDPAFHSELRGRQRLTEHLTAEDLRAADVAAVAAEDVVFNALERELPDQVFENRTHFLVSALA